MDQVIWVEVLSRHRDVAARFRVAGPQALIGRGYDNDVIVDDPYVAERHVRVFRDDNGHLVAEDAGSRNGMFLDRDKTRHARIVIDGERPIRIGHTYLRIRETSHAVAGERTGRQDMRAVPLVLVAVLVVALVATEVLWTWINETGEQRASHYLQPLLGLGLLIGGWVAVWALLSRVFSGRARFEHNLLIALAGYLVFRLYSEFAHFTAFAFAWRTLVTYDYVAMWCILAAICFFHLREVGPSRLKLKGAVVAALLAAAIAVHTLKQSETFHDLGQQNMSRRLMPPAFRLVPVRDAGDFFADIEQLKLRLDRDRIDAQNGGDGR